MPSADQRAQTFMTKLQQAERSGDAGPLAAMFAADAECGSIATQQPRRGVWTSEGTLPTGTAINYQGVSLVEFGPDGKVNRFRTYYDSAAFLPEGAKTLGREVRV